MSVPKPLGQPVQRRTKLRVRLVGSVRVPVAGPYRPVARLYQFPDGRLLWHLCLWEVDRPVPHLVGTSALIAYARANGLRQLEQDVDRCLLGVRRARV